MNCCLSCLESSRWIQNSLMKNVIIFGAGQAGLVAKDNLAAQVKVLAFCDNNAQKVGSQINGTPIVSPAQLWGFEFDEILIASEFFEQIERQLIEDCQIPPEKVVVLPTTVIKPRSFVNPTAREYASELLLTICRQLEQDGVHYYVDAGTLLGLYRDGALIPWDDDLDIAIGSDSIQKAKSSLTHLCEVLQQSTRYKWQVQEYYSNQDFGAVTRGDVRSLALECEESGLPKLDVFVKYVNGEMMDYVLSSRGIRMPSGHLLTNELFEFKGQCVSIPSDPEGYLTRHYGDWQTPVKDWNLGMLQNATVF